MARNKTNFEELSTRRSKIKHLVFSEDLADTDSLVANEPDTIFARNSVTSSRAFVEAIDSNKRAYDISSESTRALEMSLLKVRSTCCFRGIRLLVGINALWIMLFRYHGLPPKKGTRHSLFFLFAMALTIDILLTLIFCVHIFHPISNFTSVGIPFICTLPGMTLIGPVLGVIACLTGSFNLLKLQSAFNRISVLINYPLTLA